MKDDNISRQAAIDAIDEIETEVADGFGFQYEKWRKHFCEMPSAQPDLILCRECEKKEVCRFYDTQGDYGYCRYGKKDGQINPQYFDLEMRGD